MRLNWLRVTLWVARRMLRTSGALRLFKCEIRPGMALAISVISLARRVAAAAGGGMGFQLQMEQMPGYLVARFTGVGTPAEVWQQYELIAEHCKRTKNHRLLIDTSRAEGGISILERFLMG